MPDVEVQFANRDGAHIAYEVFGSGPVDLIVNTGAVFPIDLMWDLPQLADFMEALGQIARVIVYDTRGCGASDPLPTTDGAAGVESASSDLIAVLDAAGSDRATTLDLFTASSLVVIAATYPRRVRSIIVNNFRSSFPEMRGTTLAQRESIALWLASARGLKFYNPRIAHDPAVRRWWERAHRLAASPEQLARQIEFAANIDVESILEHVHTPTLVFHRQGNQMWDIQTSRSMASRIPNARFVELPGSEVDLFFGDTAPVLAEITRFLEEAGAEVDHDQRQLATVLFGDIVASTEQLVEVGDEMWRKRLDDYDEIIGRTVAAYRGQVIKTMGDGYLATFDGPARAVRCAADIRDAFAGHGIAIRTGLHTGEIELRGRDIAGIAVHIASRIAALAGAGDVYVSETVVHLTSGSGITYDARGDHTLKGVPGSWSISASHAPPSSAFERNHR
jgi:class 3 adenylate cyclase